MLSAAILRSKSPQPASGRRGGRRRASAHRGPRTPGGRVRPGDAPRRHGRSRRARRSLRVRLQQPADSRRQDARAEGHPRRQLPAERLAGGAKSQKRSSSSRRGSRAATGIGSRHQCVSAIEPELAKIGRQQVGECRAIPRELLGFRHRTEIVPPAASPRCSRRSARTARPGGRAGSPASSAAGSACLDHVVAPLIPCHVEELDQVRIEALLQGFTPPFRSRDPVEIVLRRLDGLPGETTNRGRRDRHQGIIAE